MMLRALATVSENVTAGLRHQRASVIAHRLVAAAAASRRAATPQRAVPITARISNV